jgi:hypothetical protein
MALSRLLLPHACTLFISLGAMAQQHVNDTTDIEKLYGVRQAMAIDCSGTPSQWGPAKKRYCCATMGHDYGGICSTGGPNYGTGGGSGTPIECSAVCYQRSTGWSGEKRSWCCAQGFSSCCPPPATTLPFDCDAGLGNFEAAWSQAKKHWCCRHEQKGCFDCDAGLSKFETGWSLAKKDWCCRYAGKGCPPGGTGPGAPGGPGYGHLSQRRRRTPYTPTHLITRPHHSSYATYVIIGIFLLALIALGIWLFNFRS